MQWEAIYDDYQLREDEKCKGLRDHLETRGKYGINGLVDIRHVIYAYDRNFKDHHTKWNCMFRMLMVIDWTIHPMSEIVKEIMTRHVDEIQRLIRNEIQFLYTLEEKNIYERNFDRENKYEIPYQVAWEDNNIYHQDDVHTLTCIRHVSEKNKATEEFKAINPEVKSKEITAEEY